MNSELRHAIAKLEALIERGKLLGDPRIPQFERALMIIKQLFELEVG